LAQVRVRVMVCDIDQFISDFCLSSVDRTWFGLVAEVALFGWSFVGLAHAADKLCDSLETLCDHYGVSEDVGGVTFMAFGSAIPEITVNVVSTVRSVGLSDTRVPQHSRADLWALLLHRSTSAPSVVDLGCGAILGSGMVAFLVIPAVRCCFSSPF